MAASSDDPDCRPTARRDPGAAVFLFLMVVIGSSTATAAKFAVRDLPVALLPLLRFGIAAACLLPLLLRGGALQRMIRDDGPRAPSSHEWDEVIPGVGLTGSPAGPPLRIRMPHR